LPLDFNTVDGTVGNLLGYKGFFFKLAAVDFELSDGFEVDFEVFTDFVDGAGLELFVAKLWLLGFLLGFGGWLGGCSGSWCICDSTGSALGLGFAPKRPCIHPQSPVMVSMVS